jgi:hypothetical protein
LQPKPLFTITLSNSESAGVMPISKGTTGALCDAAVPIQVTSLPHCYRALFEKFENLLKCIFSAIIKRIEAHIFVMRENVQILRPLAFARLART